MHMVTNVGYGTESQGWLDLIRKGVCKSIQSSDKVLWDNNAGVYWKNNAWVETTVMLSLTEKS